MRRWALPAVISIAATLGGTSVIVAQAKPPTGSDKKAPEEPALDPVGQDLGAKTDALEKQAAALLEAYRAQLKARIEKLAGENPTLKRLHGAGIFNLDGLMAGVPDDPLSALPAVRTVYENLDQTAREYVNQFGGVAKEKAEAAAIEYMKKIVKAQQVYREDDKDGNGILDYAVSFQDLGALGLLHVPPMKKGDLVMVVEGYKFRIVRADTLYWAADGAPSQPGQSGDVYLFVDQTGVIRGEKDKPAGPSSPPVK